MFTNQKIEPSLWPWAYLQSIEGQDTTTWVELREQIPTVYNLNGLGSDRDAPFVFKDMYVDLAEEALKSSELVNLSKANYLS